MIEIQRTVFWFRVKSVHLADHPYDVAGCAAVSFSRCKSKVDAPGFTRIAGPVTFLNLTQDLDVVWQKIHRLSCRRKIARAEREGIAVRTNRDYEEFYSINKSFLRHKGIAPLSGLEPYTLGDMRRHGTLFAAERDGEILGGHLYLEDADRIAMWLSASKRLEVDKETAMLIGDATRLLHWEAIKYAKTKGIREFSLGGLFPEQEGAIDARKKAINDFKLSFGGQIDTRYSYRKVYSPLYRLGSYLYDKANDLRR